MASPSLIHHHTPYKCCYYKNSSKFHLRYGTTSSSSPSTSSSSSSSSYSNSSPSSSKQRSTSNFSGLNTSSKSLSSSFQAMSAQGNVASAKSVNKLNDEPDHLLVLVHGILASPSDWTYVEAELKKRLGRTFLIYASSSNTFTKTFHGIDGAGKRLADEVKQVVQKTESLTKISFLAHSLGGLFARYAIAVLYSSYANGNGMSDEFTRFSRGSNIENATSALCRGTIAGLEPINFITLATPHLGVRGKKQLPFLLGVPFLEKIAAPMAPIVAGRTGRQLFLLDDKPSRPPLLLRMTSDCEDGKFISSLGAFRCRIVYANVTYDHMVGWRTSSIRRETELVKPPKRSLDGYKHVVDVDYCPPVSSEGPNFPPEAAKAKEAVLNTSNAQKAVEYHDIMEDEMIRGLQRLGWKKVDVSFHSALWPFLAHNNICVKSEWIYNAGAGVVAHVADSLKQQESSSSSSFISPSL
ncbi:hypothetical protein MKW94_027026 [Papaver nudicaule]|uniref:DUF676 domain-containing protein n=1 Tax=Papaver nudicaule TaxID=74823 RepID=A0AA41SFJ6_PAPNU|nr:hypothetical protein [Papaver nudicaule]